MIARVERFAAVLSMRWRKPSNCEACGSDFTCGATLSGCWCSEIELSNEQRAALRGRYRKCLCRGCLTDIASASHEIEKSDVRVLPSD